MTKLNSKNNRRSRGFTVVELVVAMSVILIVSATAISLINTQNTVYLRTLQTVEATNMAENAIECFRYAVDNPASEGGVNKAFEDAFSKTFVTAPGSLYKFESNGMTITIAINGKTLEFNAVDTSSKKVILTESYTK